MRIAPNRIAHVHHFAAANEPRAAQKAGSLGVPSARHRSNMARASTMISIMLTTNAIHFTDSRPGR